jgi:two-component system, cell cycle sensor histidine kinase and response regulator CckA
MEAVGQLAGGIAHDFNNLLTVIRGNADLLRETVFDGTGTELVDEVRLASDRASELVRKLLMFSRRQPACPEVLDLNAVVTNLAGLLRRLLDERIAIEIDLEPGPASTRIDRSHIEQVLMNLAVNARDAMPSGGTLTIGTEIVAVDRQNRFVRIIVSDTGVGMTEAVKSRIFEPFFSTKGPERGSGLGLATVYGIVEQAGGQIQVDSAPGAGTTFIVDFPWCGEAVSGAIALPSTTIDRGLGGGRTVLLVEDEDAVRKFARLALENQGYAVVDAPDGEKALELLAAHPPFDVLVTDMRMPGIDGCELAEQVRLVSPDLRVVLVSGYVPESDRVDGVKHLTFLPKPFTPGDLVRTVSKALRGSNPSRSLSTETCMAAAT